MNPLTLKFLFALPIAGLLVAPTWASQQGTATDTQIQRLVREALRNDARVADRDITISVKQGVVTLSGTVTNLAGRKFAIGEAEKIDGVVGVIDKLVTSSVYRPDSDIAQDVRHRLANNVLIKSQKLKVTCEKGAVTLTGDVEDYGETRIAEELATEVRGVTDVHNRLLVSGTKTRSDDAIRDEVRGLLERDVILTGLPITVKVEGGVVRLEGIVGSSFEQRRAALRLDYVSHIKGVQNNLIVDPARDRGTRKTDVVSDQELAENVRQELKADSRLHSEGITVSILLGEIVLEGSVPSYFQKEIVEQDARNVFGVLLVKNALRVQPTKRSDSEINFQLKRDIQADTLLHDQNIQISVQDGVVSLTGIVHHAQDKSHAGMLAQRIGGVKDVRNHLEVQLLATASHGDDEHVAKKPETTATPQAGSGIQTNVERKSVGKPLTDEDMRHVSVLGTHLLYQIDRAREGLDADDNTAAEAAVGKAAKVCEILHGMLPKTHVKTTVKDADGKVIYEDEENMQTDRITVFSVLTEVNVTQPIVESKKKVAEVKGQEYEGTGLVEADVIVDLGFVQRRLKEAERTIKTDLKAADRALAEAQVLGTDLAVTTSESPLDEARRALQYAHQAAGKREYEAAQANLRIAHGYLTLYHEIAPDDNRKEVADLTKEMQQITNNIPATTAATHEKHTSTIKSYLDKVTGWWTKKATRAASSAQGRPAATKTAQPANTKN